MLIYDTRVVERRKKRRCARQSTDSRAETFCNRMRGEIYDSQKGKTIYDTQVCCSGCACLNFFKSERISYRHKGRTIHVTHIATI